MCPTKTGIESPASRRDRGFSLIELMVTLTVAAILLALAAPSFQDMIMNNRQTTSVNELVGDLSLARSEAVKRRQQVVLCPRSGGGCAASGGTTWGNGWLVFVDSSPANGTYDAGTDTILRQRESQHGGYTLSNSRTSVVFNSDGQSPGTNTTFYFCDPRGPTHANGVVLSNAGRTRLSAPGKCS